MPVPPSYKRAVSAPLLTGYLVTSDGRRWTADRKYYRLGNEKYASWKAFLDNAYWSVDLK